MNPYSTQTRADQEKMLRVIGVPSVDALFDQIPERLRTKNLPCLQPALSEMELQKEFRRLADKNVPARRQLSFLGGGYYERFIPSAVAALATRAEFLTSYTPYQPEISQGNLQAFFEFQTMVCDLFAMDLANASLYDGSTALGEAVILACGERPKAKRIIVSRAVHPEYRALIRTSLGPLEIDVVEIGAATGETSLEDLKQALAEPAACVVMQQPNFFGVIEAMGEASQLAHDAGALFVANVEPLSCALIAPPGEYDADIAVAEGQGLGCGLTYGGDAVGLFAAKKEFMRKVPGRLVGLAQDRRGRRGFVLTLQTREQHIRREKAASNICTNHAQMALRVAIYLALMGPDLLRQVAERAHANAAWLREKICEIKGMRVPFAGEAFGEFVVEVPRSPADLIKAGAALGILPGIDLSRDYPELDHHLLVCATETKSLDELQQYVDFLKSFSA